MEILLVITMFALCPMPMLILSSYFCVHACDMSCALSMSIIFSHDMIAMISSSMLHLRTTSLHDLITMLAYVASPMIHTCSFHVVDNNHLHAFHMIVVASCHISPCVASFMLDDLPCME